MADTPRQVYECNDLGPKLIIVRREERCAHVAAMAAAGVVLSQEGEADLPCVICTSPLFTLDNDILKCKGAACKIVVHQGG